MATLTKQVVTLAGQELSVAAAAAGGDQFLNSGKDFLLVRNGHADTARTVTINSQLACSYGSDHDIAVVCAAQKDTMIGPFPKNRFNNTTGYVLITYSDSAANLSVAVIEVA